MLNKLMQNTAPILVGGLMIVTGCSGPGNDETATATPVAKPPATAPVVEPAPPPPPPAFTFVPAMDGLPDVAKEGMWKCDPIFADFNADGHLDLAAIPRMGFGPRVWLGDGTGKWTESSEGLHMGARSCGGGIEAGDINGDGHLDLAVADHCAGVFVYLGSGNGTWLMVTRDLFPTDVVPKNTLQDQYKGAEDLALGDVNGDGHLDIVAASSDEGGISLYHGNGTGQDWARAKTGLPPVGWCNRVLLADMNDDGRLDVVGSFDPGPRVWLNEVGDAGAERFKEASEGLSTPTIRGLYRGIAVGDVNGDGRSDVAVANWVDGPEVYLQQPGPWWQKTPDVFPKMMGGSVGLAMGDLDRDGNLDMLVSGRLEITGGYVRGIFALRGDGQGGWTFLENSGLPNTGLSAVDGIGLGDFNGDGYPDVALGSGLAVESAKGAHEPSIPQRLLAWTTRPAGTSGAATRGGDEQSPERSAQAP